MRAGGEDRPGPWAYWAAWAALNLTKVGSVVAIVPGVLGREACWVEVLPFIFFQYVSLIILCVSHDFISGRIAAAGSYDKRLKEEEHGCR